LIEHLTNNPNLILIPQKCLNHKCDLGHESPIEFILVSRASDLLLPLHVQTCVYGNETRSGIYPQCPRNRSLRCWCRRYELRTS